MGNLRLHIGPRGNYYYFRDDILRHLDTGEQDTFLYLVPVNRAVRYLKKELVSRVRNQALPDPAVFTFRSFLHTAYQKFPHRKKMISQSMRLLLLDKVLRKHREGMQYFQARLNLGEGLILRTDKMVEEFFQFGYRPGKFTDPPLTAENKYTDFGQIVDEIFKLYGDQLIDESALLGETVAGLNVAWFNKHYPQLKTVYISGFGIYSPPMLQFIRKIREFLDVEINLAYDRENMELFEHTRDAFNAISVFSDQIVAPDEKHSILLNHLFQDSVPEIYGKGDLPAIGLQCVNTRYDEIRYMAVKIKQLHQDQGIPLNRIGITFPDIEKYAPLIRQVFHEFQIPFNLSTGFSLQESPLIQAFMQVLRIAARGFSCDDMYQLLLSPFLSAPLVEEADLIRRTAAKYRLTYLTDSWPDLIRGYFKRNKDFPPFDKYYGEKLDSMLEGIANIYTKIKPLSQPLTAAAFHRTYMDTLQGLGLLTWYEQNRDALNIQEQEKEYRAFNRFVKLLDQVVWILKYMHQETPVSPADIYRNVSMVIQNATYNLREWSDYGVQIMPRLEILSLDMETLFVGGMVEGEFPRLFTRDIFFNDNERSEMGLNASEDLLSQDRFLFFQLLSAHAGQMVFSYPAFDTEKQLLPSTFIHALQRAMPGLEIMPPQAEKEYLNENSLLEYLGLAMQTGIQTEEEGLYRSWLTKKNIPRALRWQTGIRSRYERADYSRFTRHEGNLSLSETAKKILEDRFTSRTHSITALESYAFCPMQYFLQRVLRLDAEEELEPSLSSLERGNAVHQVLYEFYDQLNADERKKPWMFADRLNHIAENVFAGLPYTDITWSIEREKYFGYDTSPGLWQVFLETEKQTISQSGFLPSQFEVSFGSFRNAPEKANAPLVIPTENGNVSIVGKIDRIDLTSDGRFIVIDYKTGSSAENIKISHIVEGFSLQLPVYIAAAGKLLKHDLGKAVPAAGIYYRVQDSHHCIQIPVFVDKEVGTELESAKDAVLPNPKLVENEVELTLADLVAKSLDYIVLYDSQIRQGRFQHTRFPDQDKCTKYCDFARICRKNTGKLLAITE